MSILLVLIPLSLALVVLAAWGFFWAVGAVNSTISNRRAGTRCASNAGAAFNNALSYHLGRLGGYVVAGAICGLIGATLQAVLDLARIGAALRLASGVLLLLIALRILSLWNPLRWLETLGAKFWRRLQPFTLNAGKNAGRAHAIALGLLWGWLPCGLVYSMLLFAALSGDALDGSAILLAFGLGTLPSMLTSSVLASQLQRVLKHRWPRYASAGLLLMFGAWMIWVSLPYGGHAHHH